MNWRRGLLRLWIAVSLAWIVAVGGLLFLFPRSHVMPVYPGADGTMVAEPWKRAWSPADQERCSNARTLNPNLGNPFACFAPQTPEMEKLVPETLVEKAMKFAVIGLLPSGLAFLLGVAALWIGRGFRPHPSS